jgi:uncharacterized membrane protein YkvI
MRGTWFQRYLLPGFIIQSSIIGGAYGSGKELQEFFFKHGPLGGLLGMGVTMFIFALVLMAAYEFSRRFQLFDYRSFSKALLGSAWPVYEILYMAIIILVISVVGAVAGEVLHDSFGLPNFVGVLGIMVLIAIIVFFGTPGVERVLAIWSFVLFGTYLLFLGWHLVQHGDQILINLTQYEVGEGWAKSGLAYSGYNLSTVPALVFCIYHMTRRREALVAGTLAGILAMLPAMLFYIAMIGQYDVISAAGVDGPLPVTILMNALDGAGFFAYLFPVVLFGTFVETGTALIHGVNERLDHAFAEKGNRMPNWMRPAVALTILFSAVVIADAIGLTGLVAKGYGTITWGFIIVLFVPLLTWGVYLIWRADRVQSAQRLIL